MSWIDHFYMCLSLVTGAVSVSREETRVSREETRQVCKISTCS